MTNQKKPSSEIRSELESEIFAIVNTIISLDQKYQTGNLKENFFQRSIKSAMNDLLRINLSLNKNNIELSKLLATMNITDNYYKAIDVINKLSSLNISTNQFSKTTSSSILEIPRISSEITSSFITVMDALKLEGLRNSDLIMKLFKELKLSLQNFPGIDDISLKIEKIKSHALENRNLLIENRLYREKLVDHLYDVFNEFQNKINLKMD